LEKYTGNKNSNTRFISSYLVKKNEDHGLMDFGLKDGGHCLELSIYIITIGLEENGHTRALNWNI